MIPQNIAQTRSIEALYHLGNRLFNFAHDTKPVARSMQTNSSRAWNMRIHAHRHYAFALAWALLPVYVEAQTLDTKPHPGHMLLETYCTVCHNLDYVTMQPRITREQALDLWTNTVRKMVHAYGAELPNRSIEQDIINYLVQQSVTPSEHFPALAEEDVDTSRTQTNSAPRRNDE